MFNRRLLSLLTVAGLVLGLSSLAMAGIPDLSKSTASSPGGRLWVCPAGDGQTLAGQGATVSVEVRDANDQPIANFPAADIWLSSAGNDPAPSTANPACSTTGISLCQGGSAASANTNAAGQTTITGTLFGGGWTEFGMQVFINGLAITGSAALNIICLSPDNTANLVVNVSDVANFAADLLSYCLRSDLVVSSPPVINLSDVATFAAHIGHDCP